MKYCDFKQVLKMFIVYFVLLKFDSVETAALNDCLPPQVFHSISGTNNGTCCIPVALPKGYSFKSCTRDGTNDTIEVCATKPVQLYQWDDTTTATEATCTPEMHCIDVENKMIENCDEHDQNCRKECVCNFTGGYCGTEYFHCIPFPVGCPRNKVQEDCSCRLTGLEPEKKSGKSDPGLPSPATPITSVSKRPSSPASGSSDKNLDHDQTADVGIMTEKDDNNNDTKSQAKQEESLSTGFIIVLTVVVIVVIGGLIFVFILLKDRFKRLWGKCKREQQDSAQPRPIQIVTPFSEDRNEEALSLQRLVTIPDDPAEQEITTQPLLPEGHPQEVNGAQANLLEVSVPEMNLSVDFPTLGNSLFDSHNSAVDQQEVCDASGRDQTHVKVANTSENLIEEEGHDSGALENSRL
ncbi:hypothetical protein ACJMK2_008737 [Sinanodonta woodiana]|uniref:Uncharacterized protein n=1 Tax=Sinanodonta woodiana TaxID=1069815 RepID=A0ABD3VMG9_SINWO